MKLFEFAYCPRYEDKISHLSGLCPEKWSFGTNTDNIILKNYIDHTFSKLISEGKVLCSESFSLFNTGLYTKFYEELYAYFVKNKVPNKQKWFFDGFYTSYQIANLEPGIKEYPLRANYFSDPADMVFNTNCTIIPQWGHIFGDRENYSRIPEAIRDSSNKLLLFDGAITRAKQMIHANYKTAVPQYYNGRIQLLIPVYLISENVPDLALVVSRDKSADRYLGHTCLTLDMAYNNARLIARPDSAWLKP